MVSLGAKRLGVLVGATLTFALACGGDAKSAASNLDDEGIGSSLELVAKPEHLIIPESPEKSPDVCVAQTFAAQPVSVSLYLMIDRSGSMQEGNKWGQTMSALRQFVRAPEADGLRVALRFFGDDEPVVGCSQHECSRAACAQPLVEAAALAASDGASDLQESALVEILEHTSPLSGFGTPIYPALGGALDWARDYRTTHNDEDVAVVLVTDGEPNGCDTNIDHISGLALDAFTTHGVRTYAIGLQGSNERQLQQIAAAGHTREGIFIGANNDAEQQLLAALHGIRTRAVGCDFLLPKPASGATGDTETLNLVMQLPSGDAQMYRVEEPRACTGDGLGFYFDDPDAPERIHLCPGACALSSSQTEARLSVVMGCFETRRGPAVR